MKNEEKLTKKNIMRHTGWLIMTKVINKEQMKEALCWNFPPRRPTSSFHLDIPKMIKDSAKNGRWIIPFKKFDMVKVKIATFTAYYKVFPSNISNIGQYRNIVINLLFQNIFFSQSWNLIICNRSSFNAMYSLPVKQKSDRTRKITFWK